MRHLIQFLLAVFLVLSIGVEAFAQSDGARKHPSLTLVFAAPEGQLTELPGAVTLIFSQPMQALAGTVTASVPVASVRRVSDGSDAAGHWVWYGAETAVFYWAAPPATATEYEVTVPASTQSLAGTKLGTPMAFRFSTPLPRLLSATIDQSHFYETHRYRVNLEFNQAIAPAEVKRAVTLVSQRHGASYHIPFRIVDPNTDPASTARASYSIDLDRAANSVDQAKLVVAGDLRGVDGPLTSGIEAAYPQLELVTLNAHIVCARNAMGACIADDTRISLEFSKTVNNLDVFRAARFSPRVSKQHYDYEGDTTSLDLYSIFELYGKVGGHYEVGFDHGLSAQDGERSRPVRLGFDLAPGNYAFGLSPGDGAITVGNQQLFVRYPGSLGFEVIGRHLPRSDFFRWLSAKDRRYTDVAAGSDLFRETVEPNGNKNQIEGHPISERIWQGQSRGAILVAARTSDSQFESAKVVLATDLGLVTHLSPWGARIWVTHLSDSTPVPGARVALLAHNGADVKFVGTADELGTVSIPPSALETFASNDGGNTSMFIVAEVGDDYTYDEIRPRQSGRVRPFVSLFTDRALYRPGELVHVKAYYRIPSPQGFATPQSGRVEAQLFSPIGQLLAQTVVNLDEYGAVHAALRLPRDMPLGHARVSLRRMSSAAEEPDEEQWFKVAQYRTLDIEAQGRLDQAQYLRGDVAAFTLRAKTLHDTPLCRAKVSWLARLEPHYFPYTDFDFTDVETDPSIDLQRDHLTLDISGRSERRFVIAPGEMHGPMLLRVEATVAEKEGQVAIAAQAEAKVFPAAFAAGIALNQKESQYFVGDTVEARPVALDVMGRSVVRPLRIAWYRMGSDPNQPRPIKGSILATMKPLSRCETASSAEPSSLDAPSTPADCTLRVRRVGHYLARIVGQDEQGRETAAAIEFYVWPKETRGWKATRDPSDEVTASHSEPRELPSDAKGFAQQCNRLGSAELEIMPRQGTPQAAPVDTVMDYCIIAPTKGTASVSLEAAGLLQHRIIQLKPGGNYVARQLARAAYPFARVRFHLVFPAVRGRPVTDERDFDYQLTDPSRQLDISLRSEAPYRPHSDKLFELRVTRQGRPVAAQVTLWAVDEGVVKQSYYRQPDPFDELRNRYDVGVETFDNRRLVYVPSLGSHRTRAPQVRAGATTVGDRGFYFRKEFPAVAWFLPNVMLDGSGRAKLRLRLPDSATTWHIYAVAAGSEASFGSYEDTITTTEDLVIRPKLPRFTRLGDRYEARFTIDHPKHSGQTARVALAVTGAANGTLEQQIAFGEDGSSQVALWVENRSIGKASWTASVDSGQSRDAVKVDQAVTATTVEEAVAFAGSTRDPRTLPIALPKDVDPNRGGLELVLGGSNAPAFLPAQQWLEQYPHRCTEQLASRLLSQAIALDVTPRTPLQRDHLRLLLLDILARQRGDGGFGYYPQSSHSDPQLSAFVLMSIIVVQTVGLDVPNPAILSLAEYLDNNAAQTSPSEQALLEDALAMARHARSWEIERLARHPEHLNPFALGVLAHAATYLDRELSRRLLTMLFAQMATSGKNMVVTDPRERDSLFASSARSTASALRALAAVDARSPLADRLTNGLLSLRKGSAWATTQDNVWTWMAFNELHKHLPQPARLSAQIAFGRVGLWQSDGSATNPGTLFVPMQRLLSVSDPTLELVVSEGELHYQGTLRFARLHPEQEARHQGFSVERILRGAEDPAPAQGSNNSFLLGSYVVMDVLVHVPVAREQVVVEAPLPAGLEAVDETLALTPRLTLPFIGARRTPVHRELREDRVLFYEEHLDPGAHVFSQLLVATTRGTFRAPAARAEAMYAPDVRGTSAPVVVEVR